jgi:purine nucleoside permease
MTVDVDALVLPAFDDLSGLPGEAAPWRAAYDLQETVHIEGVPAPVRYMDRGLAVVPTGIGKTAAAATTTALFSSGRFDLNDALVISVGVAGGPPALAVGSVVIADTVVDWDDKCRFDPTDGDPIALNPYTEGSGVFDLDPKLVSHARSLAEAVDLAAEADTAGDPATDGSPEVVAGTNLCGDELWHGHTLAEQAAWLVDARNAGPYRATEMEDAGTAAALDRFGCLDRYLTVRGISNHDRPEADASARDSFFASGFESGFELGIENAVRVARRIVEDRLE